MYNFNSNPRVTDCRFINSSADGGVGGPGKEAGSRSSAENGPFLQPSRTCCPRITEMGINSAVGVRLQAPNARIPAFYMGGCYVCC